MPAITLTVPGDTDVMGYEQMYAWWQAISAQAAPPYAIYDKPTTDPNKSTTSTTFTDIDATANTFNLTVTTTGNPVQISTRLNITGGTNGMYVYIDLLIDGTSVSGGNGIMVKQFQGATEYMTFSTTLLNSALGAGPHTFKLQWRVSNSTATLVSTFMNHFSVLEI